MKKTLFIINSILYFILYSISLCYAGLELGINLPSIDGIGMIWIFPIVYLLFFIISLKFIFIKTNNNSSYLTMGIGTISFISVCWCISSLFKTDQEPYAVRNMVYPAVLFGVSFIVFINLLCIYINKKRRIQK